MTADGDNATSPVREQISKRLRFEVFKRDGFQCCYCGATPPNVILEADHLDPVSLGGKTDLDNLITACRSCNRGKSNIQLSDVPQSMTERAAEVIERESQVAGYESIMKQRRMRLDADAREVFENFCESLEIDSISKRDFLSIRMFIERLGLDTCLWASDRALQKRRTYYQSFKYFCGICWSKIREMEGGQ